MHSFSIPWAKPDIGTAEKKEVLDCFETGWLSMGPKVRRFEAVMGEYMNSPHAVAVSNGTVALDMANSFFRMDGCRCSISRG